MPLVQARDKTAVEPDHVYVIPPDYSLIIERGRSGCSRSQVRPRYWWREEAPSLQARNRGSP